MKFELGKALPATFTGYWFLFFNSHLWVAGSAESPTIPFGDYLHGALNWRCIGNVAGIPCFAGELTADFSQSEKNNLLNLRQLYGQLDETFLAIAGRAIQLVEWERTHRFCSRCGQPLDDDSAESTHAKRCQQCKQQYYPRITPAIIVAVIRGEELLLARGKRHPAGWYSVIAGFLEAGETVEACVQREVAEETGIQINQISYFGSQSWPFPNTLMLGFTAEYLDGELTPQTDEIEDLQWFHVDALPRFPAPPSIAHSLIQAFITKHRPSSRP